MVRKKEEGQPVTSQKWNFMGSSVFFPPWQEKQCPLPGWRRYSMSIGTIILIILVIALLGGFSGIGGGPIYGTGYYGGGGLGARQRVRARRGPMTGSARTRNPYPRQGVWIPGLRLSAHPGMTIMFSLPA